MLTYGDCIEVVPMVMLEVVTGLTEVEETDREDTGTEETLDVATGVKLDEAATGVNVTEAIGDEVLIAAVVVALEAGGFTAKGLFASLTEKAQHNLSVSQRAKASAPS